MPFHTYKSFKYNALKSSEQKKTIFKKALNGMVKWHRPDIILIACNTLSSVYNQTEFSRSTGIPVIAIVEYGVDMLYDKLMQDTASHAIILGTPTTIEKNVHKKSLVKMGVNAERIVAQSCKLLESKIQDNPESDIVKGMIKEYALESLENITDTTTHINVGLFCTHYGYVSNLFENVFSELSKKQVTILNPNYLMSRAIFPEKFKNRFTETHIDLKITSRAEITGGEMNGIGKILYRTSPVASEALRNYRLNKHLFPF